MENRKDALSSLSNKDFYFLMGDNSAKNFGESTDQHTTATPGISSDGDPVLSTSDHPTPPPHPPPSPATGRGEGEEDGEDEGEGGEGGGGWGEERVGEVSLFGVPIVSLFVEDQERLCLAQISASLLQDFSYNEIHNRRVALGITCLQCTPSQLEVLRRAGAMPVTSRRCGLITKREAERLVRSFISDVPPPRLPDNFFFRVRHQCGWGNEGIFVPVRYNSSRAKCIKCSLCEVYFSPNKFIFHCHPAPAAAYRHPDAANFNSWRRHLELVHDGSDERLLHAWEDVKAMFNGGSRKRLSIASPSALSASSSASFPSPARSSVSFESYLQRAKNSDEGDTRGHGYLQRAKNSDEGDTRGHSYLQRAKNSDEGDTRGHGYLQRAKNSDEGDTRGHGNNNNRDARSWTKLSLEKGVALSHAMTPFPAGSALGLMPGPSLGPGTHPAFLPPGVPGSVPPLSYGEFLRSMSRPYTLPLPLPANTLLPDVCRASPASHLAPAMFGTNPYPLGYLGYPPYLSATSGPSRVKGGNAAYFSSQLPDLREFGSASNVAKGNDKDMYDVKDTPTIQEDFTVTEDTQDDIIVDEEEDDKEKTDERPSPPTRERNEDERRRGAASPQQTNEDPANSPKAEQPSGNGKDGAEVGAGSQKEMGAGSQEQMGAGSQHMGAGNQKEVGAGSQKMGAGSQKEMRAGSQEMGAGSQKEVGAGSQKEVGAGSQKEMGAGSQEMGAGSQEEMGAGSQNEVGAGSQKMGAGSQEMGAGSQEEMGAGSQKEMGAGSQKEVGAGSQKEMGAGSQKEVGAGSQKEVGAGSQEEMGAGSQEQMGAGSQEEMGAARDRDSDGTGSKHSDGNEEEKKPTEERKTKASCLPTDTKSLLAILERTEDVDTLVHLPIETLRILYRASKKKSRATDGELRKVKEVQRLQALRAEEVREQLSRQFFALKETQRLTSQNYAMFSRLK